jgi:hypothetical protein
LVVWHMAFIFPYIGNVITPIGQPPTSYDLLIMIHSIHTPTPPLTVGRSPTPSASRRTVDANARKVPGRTGMISLFKDGMPIFQAETCIFLLQISPAIFEECAIEITMLFSDSCMETLCLLEKFAFP